MIDGKKQPFQCHGIESVGRHKFFILPRWCRRGECIWEIFTEEIAHKVHVHG